MTFARRLPLAASAHGEYRRRPRHEIQRQFNALAGHVAVLHALSRYDALHRYSSRPDRIHTVGVDVALQGLYIFTHARQQFMHSLSDTEPARRTDKSSS